MREKLRNAVIAACRVWSMDNSCGCYPQCAGCTKLSNALHDLLVFEAPPVTDPLAYTRKVMAAMLGTADPPESREAMGNDDDFEGADDGH